MQGSITCTSTLGEGSTFSFSIELLVCDDSIPSTPKEIADECIVHQQHEFIDSLHRACDDKGHESCKTLSDCKILLVEDNVVSQRVGTKMLSSKGYQVKIASDGVQCVDMVQSEEFDLILMDCHMPRLDGFAAAKAIREKEEVSKDESSECNKQEERTKKRIPIIAMTALATKDTKEKCLRSGMDACLTKPVSKDVLLKTLAEFTPLSSNTRVDETPDCDRWKKKMYILLKELAM